jgi:hypothetical protein
MLPRNLFSIFTLLCLLVFIFAPIGDTADAKGITALNVAVLPVVNTDKYSDKKVIRVLEGKIARHFRYPYYETIEPEKVKNAVLTVDAIFEGKRKNYDEEFMRGISKNLAADIVVVAELKRVRSYIYTRWFGGDSYEKTEIVLYCYTYSLKDNKYDKVMVRGFDFDTEGVFSGLNVKVPELTDKMLDKILYKTIPE